MAERSTNGTNAAHPRLQALSEPRTLVWRARSPLRISFAGGGSDFPHLFREEPGAVLCTGISLYATASLYAQSDRSTFHAIDRDLRADAGTPEAARLPLHDAAARVMRPAPGYLLETEVPVPPGSGLAASSALLAAMLAALGAARGRVLNPLDLGRLTYFTERQVAGQPGGMQDQFATAVGGICYMEFGPDGVHVSRLDIPDTARADLESRLLLLRQDATTEEAARPENHGPAGGSQSLDYLRALRGLTQQMRSALVDGRVGAFSLLLHEAWEMKRGLGLGAEPAVEAAYEVALERGALGGKQLGGPGGQHLLVLVDPSKRRGVTDVLRTAGWSEVPATLSTSGTQVWNGRGM